jgi:hypothetical protein
MSSGLLRRVVWQTFTNVSEVLVASIISAIALMMEAASTSEKSSSINIGFCNFPFTLIILEPPDYGNCN